MMPIITKENDSIQFRLNIVTGYCVLDSWFKIQGDKMIGMGSKKTFDENGKLIFYEETETGLVCSFI